MNTEPIDIILKNKIYEGIFEIFENELQEISRFVALTAANMAVYSNKIHELHLRVCSEVENVLKIVIHTHFDSEDAVKALWEETKSARLEEKGLVADYEKLHAELNNKKSKQVDRMLFGFPDFSFYFNLACERFHLDQKVIKFSGLVSHVIEWQVLQPFQLEEGHNLPQWWENYNKLKHDKIVNFQLCTLGDLIYSLSGFYILVTYLLKYPEQNHPIPNRKYRLDKLTINIPTMDCSFCSIKSKFFEASSVSQLYPLSSILPGSFTEEQYQEIRIGQLEKQMGTPWRNLDDIRNTKLLDLDLKSTDYADPPETGGSPKWRNVEHSIFYVYLDYERVVNLNRQYFMELKLYGRFIN